MKKDLLIFAHRGEAKAFFSHFHYKAHSLQEGLYESKEHFLLITGEGPWMAGPKLALVLGALSEEIKNLINLGIAGSIREGVEPHQVYPIRTVYLEQNDKLQFSSHTLSHEGLDLITCHTRVLDGEKASYLDNFAPLVDRELWSLAQIASLSGHTLKAFKLISDQASDQEICQRVKEKSDFLSSLIYSFFKDYNSSTKKDDKEENKQSDNNLWEGFYFTTSLKNQREKLLRQLEIKFDSKEKVLNLLQLHSLLEREESPKQKAILLIDKMRELLNPLQADLKEDLHKLGHDLKKAGALIKYPKDFEKTQFHLSAHIERPDDLISLIKAMEEFDWPSFVKIIEGKKLHV